MARKTHRSRKNKRSRKTYKKGGTKTQPKSPTRKSTRTRKTVDRYKPPSPTKKTNRVNPTPRRPQQTQKVKLPIHKKRYNGWWYNQSARAKHREKHKLTPSQLENISRNYYSRRHQHNSPSLSSRFNTYRHTAPIGTSFYDAELRRRSLLPGPPLTDADQEAIETDLMLEHLDEGIDPLARV